MGTKYPDNSVSGYNATPPADDGSTISSNAISWLTHILKIGNPLKAFIEKINTDIIEVLDRGPRTGFGIGPTASDNAKVLQHTAGNPTLPLISTLYAGYYVTLKNIGSTNQTINVQGADTIEGQASLSYSPADSITLMIDSGLSQWLIISRKTNDIVFSSVELSANQTISGSAKVLFNTLRKDDNADFDITTNYRYTAPETGLYRITSILKWQALISGDELQMDLLLNAVQTILSNSVLFASGISGDQIITWTGQLTSGDYLEVFAENITRNTSNVRGGAFTLTSFSAEKI